MPVRAAEAVPQRKVLAVVVVIRSVVIRVVGAAVDDMLKSITEVGEERQGRVSPSERERMTEMIAILPFPLLQPPASLPSPKCLQWWPLTCKGPGRR